MKKTFFALLLCLTPGPLLAADKNVGPWPENSFVLEGATDLSNFSGAALFSHDLSDNFLVTLEAETGGFSQKASVTITGTSTSHESLNENINVNEFVDIYFSCRFNKNKDLLFLNSFGLGLDIYDVVYTFRYSQPSEPGQYYGEKEYSGLGLFLKADIVNLYLDQQQNILCEAGLKCRIIPQNGAQSLTATDITNSSTDTVAYNNASGLWFMVYPEVFFGIGYGF